MGERQCLREHLSQYGMSVAWLTDDGYARLNGTPKHPYFEPYPADLRSDRRNRIPIYDAVAAGKLVFPRALLQQLTPTRVSLGSFLTAPIISSILLALIIYTKLNGTFSKLQAMSNFAISIEENNRLPVEEFPFDQPLKTHSNVLMPGTFCVQEANGRVWVLGTIVLTCVNLIEFEV